MHKLIPVLAAALALLLADAAGAQVEYTLLEGTVSLEGSEGGVPLTGGLRAGPLLSSSGVIVDSTLPEPVGLLVDDFGFLAGDRILGPRKAVEYEGLTPLLLLQVPDQIGLDPTGDTPTWLRTGGEIVDIGEDQVTFRFLDFRGEGPNDSDGDLPGSGLPRRIQVEGKLFEADRSFRIRRDGCAPIILVPPIEPQPPGGGVIISTGAGLEIPALTAPVSVSLGDVPVPSAGDVPAQTPDELGITAPEGVVVTLSADGVLHITSTGDLFIDWVEPEIPGLTRVVIETPGSVEITNLELPPGVDLEINAGTIDIPGDVPGDVIVTPEPGRLCLGLLPIFPDDTREVGSFSFVATAATPVGIDVRPWSARNRIDPDRPGLVSVALLGSESLDVRDVVRRSLRLGRGEAEPLGRRRPRVLRVDVNGDRHRDLVVFFDGRDAEIAYGDSHLCLTAETRDGALLEGCDAIRALPRWARRLGRASN